jgi:hypothetical protein
MRLDAELCPTLNLFVDACIQYAVILSDVWAVIHDGAPLHPMARVFRKSGGTMIQRISLERQRFCHM